MFGWRADDGPALNANRAAFEFSSLGGGGGGKGCVNTCIQQTNVSGSSHAVV